MGQQMQNIFVLATNTTLIPAELEADHPLLPWAVGLICGIMGKEWGETADNALADAATWQYRRLWVWLREGGGYLPWAIAGYCFQGGCYYLSWFGVAHQLQGGGIGGEMLRQIIGAIKAERPEAEYLYVETDSQLLPSLQFYYNQGFRLAGSFAGLEHDTFYLRKNIRKG